MELNIVYIEDHDEEDQEAKFVCPQCHGIVEYQTFERKSSNPIYDWNCGSCFSAVPVEELHLKLKEK